MNRLLLGAALALAIAAFGRSTSTPLALVGCIAAIAAPLGPPRKTGAFVTLLVVVAWIALVATAIITWSLLVVLMVHGDSTDQILRALGAVLAVLGVGLIAAGRDGLAMVVTVALLDVAGLHRQVEIRQFVISAALALLFHLARPRTRGRTLAIAVSIGIASAIATALPPAQRAIERAAFAAFTPKSARSGLSGDDARLGDVESLATSDRLVLRVWSDRPERLRARVYLKFDGRTWHVARGDGGVTRTVDAPLGPNASSALSFPGSLHALASQDPAALAGTDVRATRIVPVDLDEGLLPSPGNLLAAKAPFPPLIDAFGILLPLGRAGDPWVALHRDREGVADERAPDRETRSYALGLPSKIDPRLIAVAEELAAGAKTPEEKILRTTEWVRAAAHYDLEVGPFRTRDPVAEFLFEKKRGYCEYFASALAVLLRLEGVPSRFVTGFAVSSENRVGEHYEVRDADAHAWVEAYVEGRGWVVADATPPAEYSAYHPHQKSRLDAIRAWLADVWLSLRHGGRKGVLRALAGVALAALLVTGVAIVVRELRRRKNAEADDALGTRAKLPQAIAACVSAIDAAFARLGAPRPRASGLLEHARSLELPSHAAEALTRAIELVHRSAFAGEPVDESAVRAATRSVAAVRGPEVR